MSTGPAACIRQAQQSDGLCWRGMQAVGPLDHCRRRVLPAWLVNLTMAGASAEASALWACRPRAIRVVSIDRLSAVIQGMAGYSC